MKLVISASLLLFGLLLGSCASGQNFEAQVNSIARPHLFSIAQWEAEALPHELEQWLSGEQPEIEDETCLVKDYFAVTERISSLKSALAATNTGQMKSDLPPLEAELARLQEATSALADEVAWIIGIQIRDTLAEQGIFNPITGSDFSFPPLKFRLEQPPYLLVISPRDRIESIREITLKPSLILEEIEDIEVRADELGVSSLVIELGGLGATYPAFVTNRASLPSTLDTATEEWLHQYLVFKPLGFRYLLDLTGLARNYEIATINETVASMVSKEIGSMVLGKYYPEHEGTNQHRTPEPGFDFNREMREIRRAVDIYLARGEVEPAEEFMEQKRQYLVSQGYHLRKLNQAYFAFHGTYADSPTSISPIGLELNKLRAQSTSLKDFLATAATIASRQELQASIK